MNKLLTHRPGARTGTRQRYLVDQYIAQTGDSIEFLCEDHAREWAASLGLELGYRGQVAGDGVEVYYVHSFAEGETDTPLFCDDTDCELILSGGLTVDGERYLVENFGPSVHHLYA